eukprot:scaffold29184_cov142-Skeletonema_dohrnii-CCMP3373.AAC.2
MGLKNVDLMVPFCRTADEVIQLLKENGLQQGKDGLKVWVIGALGWIGIRAFLLDSIRRDEDNTAVREAISLAIKDAHSNGKEEGICCQAPSDKPHFARFLVDLGIDISAVLKVNILCKRRSARRSRDIATQADSQRMGI